MEDIWLRYAKRLQALATTGATYATDRYDQERYQEIGQIAVEMMAALGTVPVARIEALVGPFAQGYATPKVDVRGAVFSGDRILLVRERADGLWALPGGFADIGLSPAENIAKEIREETCLEVRVAALIGVRHKAKGAHAPDVRDFYKLFFACDVTGTSDLPRDADILEWGYFPKDEVPPLSQGRTSQADIEMAFAYRHGPGEAAFH
ncbi:NUDIX hydrolase [Salipiger sp. P9]|uniref:NUDIX hydrolase n=1 Tax=Salipiger pentaromativorans TaxID=2943193 RepID=UPI0021579712|nr:NUDIX hydrolase [Salipiger pentaromativorans]MCR8549848.1 NUDIX hydrolase [Salipiger pentaromativorans]